MAGDEEGAEDAAAVEEAVKGHVDGNDENVDLDPKQWVEIN